MAVIAVPGAGKTHCLIARMVRMIKNGILPEQILFVTFTKKAAGEILERARRVLGEESALPAIFTFHSLGYTILRKHVRIPDSVEKVGQFFIFGSWKTL